jgi:hypothetical protein
MATEQQRTDASKLWVDEWFAGCDKISWLELVKIQARVLLPVLRALRAELGAERANQLVAGALRGWSRDIYQRIGEQMPGERPEKFQAMFDAWMPKIGADVDIEPVQQNPEHLDLNVTGCRYADFFRQLGEPELGALLLCEQDFHVTEQITNPEVKLERTQTIMKGAKYCGFRYTIKRDAQK